MENKGYTHTVTRTERNGRNGIIITTTEVTTTCSEGDKSRFGFECDDPSCCRPGDWERLCREALKDFGMESDCHLDGCPCCNETESESDDEVPPPVVKKTRIQPEEPISTCSDDSTTRKEEPELEFNRCQGDVIALPWYDLSSHCVTKDLTIQHRSSMEIEDKWKPGGDSVSEDEGSTEVFDLTIRKSGKLPSRATTRPGWAQPNSLSGRHPGTEGHSPTVDSTSTELDKCSPGLLFMMTGLLFMMTGTEEEEEEITEQTCSSVANLENGPTETVSELTPSRSRLEAADEGGTVIPVSTQGTSAGEDEGWYSKVTNTSPSLPTPCLPTDLTRGCDATIQ